MSSRCTSWAFITSVLLFIASCGNDSGGASGALPPWEEVCIDVDGDGYGIQCANGPDCDDTDKSVFENCAACSKPEAGCACESGSEPVDCVISRTFQEDGSMLCNTGKMYCRDGLYTECIGTKSFEVPSPAVVMQQIGAVVDGDASPVICDACAPDCYRVDDNLETVTNEDGIMKGPGGGLTLWSEDTNAGVDDPDAVDPVATCTPGQINPALGQYDDDCDGIPDNYDDNTSSSPFATQHSAITFDLDPGEEGAHVFELQFFLNTVDVYFLIDTTGSMDGELGRLITDLTSGTFLDDPSTPVNEATKVVCASPPGSTTSDPTLKNKGIAGNIACLVPDSGFGAGFFREIPFSNADANGIRHTYDWFIPFEHRQDISGTVDDTTTALKKFPTAGNLSWPEADIFALQAVATGEQIYTGWDRPGVPARTCPNPTKQFGWPCFRKEAVPVVVLITDASMMNGPNVDVYNNQYLSYCATDPWTFFGTIGSCSSNSQCVANVGSGSVCSSSKCTCVTDAHCVTAFGSGAFCSASRCVKENPVPAGCEPDGVPDNVVSAAKHGNSGNKFYPVSYSAANTNNMSVTPDRTYHPVSGNETFANAYDVGDIGTSFKTYTGDTRGMSADVHLGNLGTACSSSKWPTSGNAAAVSATTPGYPDAVFKFKVTNPNQKLTVSTRGTHHAPTLAIVPVSAAGAPATTTVVSVPASGDTSPWNVSGSDLSLPFDYSVNLNMSSYTGQLPRESFGSCMAGSGGTDYAPDAVFAFTPASDVQGATFSTGAARVVPESATEANAASGVSLGVVDGQTVSYTGTTTTSTTAKWTGGQTSGSPFTGTGCRSSASTTGREHVVSFRVTNPTYTVRMRLTASFDGVLGVYGPSTSAPVAGTNIPNYLGCSRVDGGDEVLTGTFPAGTYYLVITGYTSSAVGTYTVTVSDPNATSEVIALFDSPPVAPTNANITGPSGVANTNDQFYDFNVGQIDGRSLRLIGGNTSASTIRADYMASGFQAAGSSCSVVSGTSSDAVIDFSVGTTRKVRIETFDGTGTSTSTGASFDHAVALIERPVQLSTVPVPVIDNDDPTTARVVSAASVPTAEGAWSQYEGATFGSFVPTVQPPSSISNTITMTPSIQAQEMYNTSVAATSTCNLVSSATQDAVYRFDVDASSAGNYDFDTVGSSTSTWLSVHKGSPDTFDSFVTPVTSSILSADNATANDAQTGAQTGVTLGTVDYKTVTYAGVTSTSTYNKWTDAQLGACRMSGGNAARENVFNFTLTQARAVRIAVSASGTYDPSVTLLSAQPSIGSSLSVTACSRTLGSVNYVSGGLTASNGVITGTLAAGTYYVVVHAYQASNNTGSYTLQVGDNTRQPRTVATDDEQADGQGPTTPVALGNAARGQVTYTSATTVAATDKWTQAQVSGTSGTGCRTAGMNDGKEHVLSFSVTDPVARTLRISLTATGTYDPVLSIFNSGSAPVAGSSVPGLMACSRVVTTTAVNQTVSAGFTASAGTIQGTFAPGTYYVIVHAYAATNQVGPYTLSVTDVDYTDVTVASASLNTAAQGAAATGAQPGGDLGVIPRRVTYAGTTASGAPDKWTQAQVSPGGVFNGCRATGANAANEHILRFTVPSGTGPRDLLITLTRTSPFDPSLTLLSAQPTGGTSIGSTELACTRVASALNSEVPNLAAGFTVPAAGQIRGTFTAGQTYYLMIHGYTTSNNAGAYQVVITDTDKQSGGATEVYATPYPRAVTVNNTQAEAVTGVQVGVDLGVADDTVISYAGQMTTSDSHNKWTQAQVSRAAASGSTGTGAPTGCRSSGNNSGREQVLKFTVNQARALTLQLARVGGTGDPSLSLFDGSAPVIGTSIGGDLVACSRVASSLYYAASGYNAATQGVISGTFPAGTYYLLVHSSSTNAVGSYTLTITDGSYSSATSPTDALLSNSSGPQPGVDLGTIDGVAVQYTGITDSTTTSKWTGAKLSGAPYTGTGCRSTAANTVSYEHVFQFKVVSSRRVAVRLQRSGSYDPVISLFNGSAPTIGRNVDGLMACSRVTTSTGQEHQIVDGSIAAANTGFITGTLAAGTYYLVVHSYSSSNPTGTFQLNVQDVTPFHLGTANGRRMQVSGSTVGFINQWTGAQLLGTNGGRAGSTVRSPESVYSFTVSGTAAKTLTISTFATGTLDSVLGIYGAAPIGGTNATAYLNLRRNSGGYEVITQSFDPGTYYVVIHGYNTNNAGTFNLEVRDDTWDDGLIACDSYGAASSLKNVALEAGNSYYVTIKGGVGPSNYGYKLNVRRSLNRPFIACDYQSLSTRRSYVEATLEGGKTYSVVLRGRTASDAGTYGVIIRDATIDTAPLGCANGAGYTGQASPDAATTFTTNLVGGKTYYMAVRSNSSGSVGAANISVQSSAAMCEYDNVTVNYSNSTLMPSEMVRTFPVGEYYAVIKGRSDLDTSSIGIPTGSGSIADDRGRGWYQITFGDATLQSTGQQFTPPTWGDSTSGVQKELVSKGIRVITVNSSPSSTGNSNDNASDPYLRAQSVAISTSTGALDTTGAAVRRTINPDGSGMGFAVVDAIAKFTQAVQMDISVRLSYDPDDPRTVAPYNRTFKFSSRAIPVAGNNGCAPPIDTDGNGTLDTFESCGPGATPRFEITVTNPKFPNNVPINPNNAGGGYLMRLELIGKDKLTANAAPQIVDTIPVYVIPANVLPDPNIEFEPSGTYTQTVNASGCTGASERPIWRGLYFRDTLPPGTSLEWRMCGGDTDAELAACDNGGFRTLATVTPGEFCGVNGECGQYGYCNENGRCEYAVGPTCLANADCGRQGKCDAGRCKWTSIPSTEGIDVKAALAGKYTNKKRMRVQVELFANQARDKAPTVHDFRVDYVCQQYE